MKLEDSEQVILEKYGRRAIMAITQEECAELIKACSKFERACGFGLKTNTTYDQALHDLVEEIADAEHCLRLMKRAFGIDTDLIENIIEHKADRIFIRDTEEDDK